MSPALGTSVSVANLCLFAEETYEFNEYVSIEMHAQEQALRNLGSPRTLALDMYSDHVPGAVGLSESGRNMLSPEDCITSLTFVDSALQTAKVAQSRLSRAC